MAIESIMEGTGMEKQKYTAIVLAAGSGKRMNSKVHKQYLIIQDRPVLYYSLKAFEDSAVDEIVLVVGKGEEKFCRKEIVDKYGISKVKAIVEGGKERYHSVFEGLKQTSDADYVLIHDGARPFLSQDLLDSIKNIDTQFDKQRVIDFKEKFMGSCDGHATERIIELMKES